MKSNLAKTLALDLAVGCSALLLTLLVAVSLHTIHHLPLFLLGVSILFFLGGFGRALSPPLHPWLNGVAVSLGALLPVFLFGIALHAFSFGPRTAAMALLLATVCAVGAQARSAWSAGHSTTAGTFSLALFAAVFLLGQYAAPHLLAASSTFAINKPAPEFNLTLLDGTPVSRESLRGHVVVLDFWGTWCAPCIAEMPTLANVYDRYRSNPDVVFVLVNSELNGDTPEKVRTFTEKHHLRIPVGLDQTQVSQNIGAVLLPSLVVLDRHGNIRMQDSGFGGAASLDQKLTQEIEALLKDK